jgi:hypothetical protein
MRAATRRTLLVLYILATPVLGIIGLATSPHKEIYPFFSWFLFALTPGHKTSYQIQIHATRDATLPTPLPYTQAKGYVPTPHAITVRELTQRLAKAIEKGDLDAQNTARSLLERHHLYPGTTYSIHRTEYDPLLVWQGKQEPITELIATFNHSHP